MLADRLINGVLSTTDAEHFMERTCELLMESGLPLWRVGVFVRTLHPNTFGRSFVWRYGAGVKTYAAPYGINELNVFSFEPTVYPLQHPSGSSAAPGRCGRCHQFAIPDGDGG